MSAIPPVAPAAIQSLALPTATLSLPVNATNSPSFASILGEGLHTMEAKLARADNLVKQFALDDSIPVHQVTFALEEAKLAVELAMQVRSRLVEGYRELMNMQL